MTTIRLVYPSVEKYEFDRFMNLFRGGKCGS